MARIAFKIEFPSNPEGFVHRLRKFAEDLHIKLARADLGNVRDINSITDSAEIEVNARRHLGEVSEQIGKTLARHNFSDAIVHKV